MSIIIKDLRYTYNPATPAESEALKGVSLCVDKGEWVSIVGHTGSGKSTLAQHMNILLLPQSGSVEIDGTNVEKKSKHLRELRRKVGLVFQYPEQQFFAETVREEIAFAPTNWGLSGDALSDRISAAAVAAGLDLSLLDANPFLLSGGQQRRVALASVIAMDPDYLVLDEPTAGLDAPGIRELFQLLTDIRDKGIAVVQITHDLQSALSHSDRILVLENGSSIAYGNAEDVAEYLLLNPVHGLVLPPLVQFAAGMQDMGLHLPLTSDIDTIMESLKEFRKCNS